MPGVHTRIRIDKDVIKYISPVAFGILPVVPYAAMPIADPHDQENYRRGITHRIGRWSAPIPAVILAQIRAHALEIIEELFPSVDVSVPSFEEWLESTSYTNARRAQLMKIHNDSRDTFENACLSRVKAFIKKEKFVGYKNPRIIASRDDPFKCFSGRFFRAVEDVVFSMPMFIKHVPVPVRARYVMDHLGVVEPGWRVYVNDHTSFEVHAHKTMAELEFQVYYKYLDVEVVDQLKKVLVGTQSISFECGSAKVDSRMSGEMNTSLGNGLANLLSVLCIVRQYYGESWRLVRTIIEGDDGIFVTPPHVVLTAQMFLDYGFDVKLEEVDSVGNAGFCSTYFQSDGRSAIVEPMKIIMGLPYSFVAKSNDSEQRLEDLRTSKALSLFYECPGVPILSALGERLLREHPITKKTRLSGDWYEEQLFEWARRNPTRQSRCVGIESRDLFCETFGWSVAEQVELEEHFRVCPYHLVLDHYIIESRVDPVYRDYFLRYAVSNTN